VAFHPLGIATALKSIDQPRIKPRGGTMEVYRPLETFPKLYVQFAKIETPEELLEFVEKFGPLTREGLHPQKGDRIAPLLAHSEAMREMLEVARNREALKRVVKYEVLKFANLIGTLAINPGTGRLQLELKPVSFLDALWLSLAQDLSSKNNLSRCDHCGHWFETGPGTGRRLDAKFCSNEHKIAFHSLKRTRIKGGDHVSRTRSQTGAK
jgi:hypothetical protein